jgi:NitT/TauT family transport system substrate-binding protein
MHLLRNTTRFITATALGALWATSAIAADKVTFLTSWYAQAEHGGFYQAKAAGLYEKAGLDVTIKMGGPQVNAMQLLLAGEADIMMSYDFLVLKSLERNIPLITVGTSFQKDLQGLLTHDHVKGLDDLKDKTILVSTPGRSTWWPWLRTKYKYTDAQTQPYTFNLQPFFADKNVVQQAYPSSEPFQALQRGVPAKFFLFADHGYPPYGTTMVTTPKFMADRTDVVRRFVKATLEGWKSYLKGDPTPGNKLIQLDNPKMGNEQIAYAIKRLNELEVLDGGDAKTMGIGIMTDARWKATYEFMVAEGQLKPEVDWTKGFTSMFVKDLKITSR